MADETVLPPSHIEDLDSVHHLLSDGGDLRLVNKRGETAPLPKALQEVLVGVVDAMRRGKAITLAPRAQRLTTQEAADVLGVSRPTLVKLLENGKIPFETPGRHRRIRLADLLAYQAVRRTERQSTLRELTEQSEALGLYDETHEEYESALEEARKKLA